MTKKIIMSFLIPLIWVSGCQMNDDISSNNASGDGSSVTEEAPPSTVTPDLQGVLTALFEPEDRKYRFEGPELGDFTHLPLNEAGLAKAREYTADTQYLPENQCKPHSPPYIMRSALPWEILQIESDVITFNMESYEQIRTIYMDGRDHPAEDAPRTPMGHSIGHWEGNTLVVDTTHFEEGYIRRNGAPHSDHAHLMERFTRDGEYLMIMITLEDPLYLTQAFTRVIAARYSKDRVIQPYPCEVRPPI